MVKQARLCVVYNTYKKGMKPYNEQLQLYKIQKITSSKQVVNVIIAEIKPAINCYIVVVFPGRLFWSNSCQSNQYLLVIINVKLNPITIMLHLYFITCKTNFYNNVNLTKIINTSMLHLYFLVFSFVNVGLLLWVSLCIVQTLMV